MVTKIAQTDKKREVKNPKQPSKPEKLPLNLNFVKENFFIEDPDNTKETREFAALTLIEDIQETLEGELTKKAPSRGGRHNFMIE